MIETILIAVAVELVLTGIALIATIPTLKKELKTLNRNFEKSTEVQTKILTQVVRLEERMDNHINDTHIHNN